MAGKKYLKETKVIMSSPYKCIREIMAESLVQCGHLMMLPKQLKRLHYDPGKREFILIML